MKTLSLISFEACKAGFVQTTDANCVTLVRWSAHKRPRLLAGVRVWDTGWAQDLTVDLSCSKHFRPTEANLRSLLGLPSK